MVDLNLWRLEYGGETQLEFGTHESGHPLVRQVVIEPGDVENDDAAHPVSDGLLMGVDRSRGMVIGFAGVHLSTAPRPPDRHWVAPMDAQGVFTAAWNARAYRGNPGWLAQLVNVDRARMAYGRPRGVKPNHELARRGWLGYQATFQASDDRWYGLEPHGIVFGVEPGSVVALEFPLTFEYATIAPTETRAWAENAGDESTYPVITFVGGGNPRLELLDGGGETVWAIEVEATLGSTGTVTVDTRPWTRGVTRDGEKRPGILGGAPLARAVIPPGEHEFKLTANDPTGLATCQVSWRDAYAAL